MLSRITQAYVSKSVADFPFHQIYSLDDYNCAGMPSVFFGCYRFEDVHVINNHFGTKVILWTGQDALDFDAHGFELKGPITHLTAHPKVFDLLNKKFSNVNLVKPASFLNSIHPKKLGTKVYAYCPSSAPEYHGFEIIGRLPFEIIIGNGSIPQTEWRTRADEFYSDVFCGLCLSSFAGGGTSIIEMGLRGIPVITNVFKLPHCHQWESEAHVTSLIERFKRHIGTTKRHLAQQVWESLDHEYKWLEYESI